MRRGFFVVILLFISMVCFPQQNMPRKIIGQIPNSNSTKLYRIQVGAFKVIWNAENTFSRLTREGFIPAYEKYNSYTRVMVTEIPANQIRNYLTRLKRIGFDEVIIREDTPRFAISEKWEVTTPGSAFVSFEFNQDNNYIAVENGETDIHFGKYTMPSKDVIDMDKLGVLRIGRDNNNGVDFSFSPSGEPGKEMRLTALKAERMPENTQTDIFCRTWKVINCTRTESIGMFLFISNAGTYFFTMPGGEANSMSKWRWYNNKTEEFEYTHDNWQHYGRAKIIELKRNYLKIFDPGFSFLTPGYSNAGLENYWELEPVNY